MSEVAKILNLGRILKLSEDARILKLGRILKLSEDAKILNLVRGKRKRGRPEYSAIQWSLHFLRLGITLMKVPREWQRLKKVLNDAMPFSEVEDTSMMFDGDDS